MDRKRSSWEFHAALESPWTFVLRERKTILLVGGAFCALMLGAVLLIDPAFFYPRLQTDPLLYFLKARALVETGSTSARLAVNVPPFAYAAMPGVLRAPVIWAFGDFDSQLRGIQILNIPIVAGVALMSAYVLSWALPFRRHWLAIVFAFAFTLFSPVWIANIFSPLADAPYAAFSLAAVITSLRIVTAPDPLARKWLILLFALLLAIAFMLRFTAPVILVYGAVLARGRWPGRISRRARLLAVALPFAFVLALVLVNMHAIFGRYFLEPLGFLVIGDRPGILLNLLAVALPSQVIPSFHLGYIHPPIVQMYQTTFASTPLDAVWMLVGLLLSAVLILGAFKSRDRLLPEFLYCLAPLPVLTLMLPSTARYLMTYQPFFWIFFLSGAAYLAARYGPRVPRFLRSRLTLGFLAVAAIGAAVGLRWWRTVGSQSENDWAVNLQQAPAYISEVSSTFRQLRRFLESLPRERTLLVGARGTIGRWTVIADRDYYMPDRGLTEAAREKDVYLVVECGTLEVCAAWSWWTAEVQKRVTPYGDFTFESVFEAGEGRARAEVFRVRPAP